MATTDEKGGKPMSDDIDLFEDDESGDLPKKLRQQIKALQKERESLTEQLSSFQKKERQTNLSVALQEKGLNPKIAAFIPQDVEGEALDSWLDEYGDVFGSGSAKAEAEQAQPVIARDAAEAQAIRQMSQVDRGAPSMDTAQDLLSQIEGAASLEDLMKVIGR